MTITKAEAIKRAEEIMYNDYRIHAGVERKVVTKTWKDSRIYINIYCYTLAGNYKGKYDLGYIELTDKDAESGEYVAKYADVALF